MRKTIETETVTEAASAKNPIESLDSLVPLYIQRKGELDVLKKDVDSYNSSIKTIMNENNLTEYAVGSQTVKYVVSHRDSLDAVKLLAVAKKFNLNDIIKTREYVDTDALESVLYTMGDDIDPNLAKDIASCYTTNEVISLKISKTKKEK